jgi:hypothetical protein
MVLTFQTNFALLISVCSLLSFCLIKQKFQIQLVLTASFMVKEERLCVQTTSETLKIFLKKGGVAGDVEISPLYPSSAELYPLLDEP